MKKVLIALCLSFIFVSSYSQKWKPGFGVEGGMGGGGMTNLLKSGNSIIVDNSELKKSWAYSYGAFFQVMSESFGIEVKVNSNSYNAEAESFATPENIKLKYFSVPVVLKIRLSSKSGVTSGSWSDDTYSLIGNTLYHHPGEYSAGGNPFTTNVFLYAGVQSDMLKKSSHSFGTTNKTTEDLSGRLNEKGYSIVAGLEFTINLLSFDFSYQKGMTSVDPNSENNINAFMVKVKLRVL